MSARALIRASAVAELESLRSVELRRQAVRLASEAVADPGRPADRIAGGTVYRRRRGALVVLYSTRGEDVVVDSVAVREGRTT